MIDEKKVLDALIKRRQALADGAMQNPGITPGIDSNFVFGCHVGTNAGLREAEAILLKQLEDEKEKDL